MCTKVVVQQTRVGECKDGGSCYIGKARRDDDAIEHARVVVGGLMRLIRAARGAGCNRVVRLTVMFDETFLHHDMCLGG